VIERTHTAFGRKRQRGARVDTRPGGPTLASVPRGAPVKELRDPPNRYRGNPLNLIRVMPAKGQDMATIASPRISLFLARLLGPLFLAIAIGVLVNGAVFRAIAEEGLRSHALIYLTGLFAMTAGVAILLNHNVWPADWRVLITIFGWLAAIGGAQRIIWPQWTEAAIHWFLANPTSLVVAGIIWLVIGAVLCFFGYFREPVPGATR
jgi:hypothetical protein